MTLLHFDGMDHYSDAQRVVSGMWTTVSLVGGSTSASISAGTGRTSASLRIVSQGDVNGYIQRTFAPSSNIAIVGFAFILRDNVARNQPIIGIMDGGTHQVEAVWNQPAGTISVKRGSETGTTLGTTTLAMSTGAYQYIELVVTVASSSNGGSVDLYVNGTNWLSLPGVNTNNTGNAAWSALRFGTTNGLSTLLRTVDYDDIYVMDGTNATATQGSPFNTPLGDVSVRTIMPTSDGNYLQFTPSSSNPTTHFSYVDENPPTDDTDFVQDGVVNDRDSYNYTVPSGSVVALSPYMYARKTDAGTRKIREFTRISGADYDGASDLTLSTSYQWLSSIRTIDPASSSTWTTGSKEFGIKVTV